MLWKQKTLLVTEYVKTENSAGNTVCPVCLKDMKEGVFSFSDISDTLKDYASLHLTS